MFQNWDLVSWGGSGWSITNYKKCCFFSRKYKKFWLGWVGMSQVGPL